MRHRVPPRLTETNKYLYMYILSTGEQEVDTKRLLPEHFAILGCIRINIDKSYNLILILN